MNTMYGYYYYYTQVENNYIVVSFRLYRIIFRCQCLFKGLHPHFKMVQRFSFYSSSNYGSSVEHLRLLR